MTALMLAGGCIEYFADPPDLGELAPQLDGGAPDACTVALEVCDGLDNDCDGAVDEQDPSLCPALELNALSAQVRCVESVCVLSCIADQYDQDGEYETGCEYPCRASNGFVEQCDALDNDCDGSVDEDLIAPLANRQAGVCANAIQVCVGQWVEPSYGEQPGYEEPEVTCDGRDNDCDGQVDEGRAVCCGPDNLGPPCNGCTGVAVPAEGWVCIPPGEFTMGSPPGEVGRNDDEAQRRVTINRPFLLQTTEVTQAAWQATAGNNPSYYREGRLGGACDADAPEECPVETVTWHEAVWYANTLSVAEGLLPCYELDNCNGRPAGERMTCGDVRLVDADCHGYRLPTEAEWEYASRAGTVTRFWSGDDEADLAQVGWYIGNSGDRVQRVAQKPANPWGLHDVHGNLTEWVGDWYGPYGPAGDGAALVDPAGPATGIDRVGRGGNFANDAADLRSAGARHARAPTYPSRWFGFRLARPIPIVAR